MPNQWQLWLCKHLNIEINSSYDLDLEKKLSIYLVINQSFKSIYHNNNFYHPQVFLEEYVIKKDK